MRKQRPWEAKFIIPVAETCIVGVQLAASVVKALTLRVSDQGDVYTNYSILGLPEAHSSYHASGQQHIKNGGSYVEWDGGPGPTSTMEPMKIHRKKPCEVITRAGVLPVLCETADMLVDARVFDGDSILYFRSYVIGPRAKLIQQDLGFPAIGVHTISGKVQVEIVAFVISEIGPQEYQ
jgi:hypothetical protein